jgi:hypothetical protein
MKNYNQSAHLTICRVIVPFAMLLAVGSFKMLKVKTTSPLVKSLARKLLVTWRLQVSLDMTGARPQSLTFLTARPHKGFFPLRSPRLRNVVSPLVLMH